LNKIALVCVMRDPRGILITSIEAHSSRLIEIYPETTIISSQDTSPKTIRALRGNGFKVVTQSEKGVGEARRDALRIVRARGHATTTRAGAPPKTQKSQDT